MSPARKNYPSVHSINAPSKRRPGRPRKNQAKSSEPSASNVQIESEEIEKLYAVKETLDESVIDGTFCYLLQWEGIDPSTGRIYKPDWIPKANCTGAVIEAWEAKKAQKARATNIARRVRERVTASSSPSSTTLSTASAVASPQPNQHPANLSKRAFSRRRVVLSDTESESPQRNPNRPVLLETRTQSPTLQPVVRIDPIAHINKDLYQLLNSSQIPPTAPSSGVASSVSALPSPTLFLDDDKIPHSPSTSISVSYDIEQAGFDSIQVRSTLEGSIHEDNILLAVVAPPRSINSTPEKNTIEEIFTSSAQHIPNPQTSVDLSLVSELGASAEQKKSLGADSRSSANNSSSIGDSSPHQRQNSVLGTSSEKDPSTNALSNTNLTSEVQSVFLHASPQLRESQISTDSGSRNTGIGFKAPITSIGPRLRTTQSQTKNFNLNSSGSDRRQTVEESISLPEPSSHTFRLTPSITLETAPRLPLEVSNRFNSLPPRPVTPIASITTSPSAASDTSLKSLFAKTWTTKPKSLAIPGIQSPNSGYTEIFNVKGHTTDHPSASGGVSQPKTLPAELNMDTEVPAASTAMASREPQLKGVLNIHDPARLDDQSIVGPENASPPKLLSVLNLYVPLHLSSPGKEVYRQVLRYSSVKSNSVKAVQQLFDICSHTDLLTDDLDSASQAMGPNTQADWAVIGSTKFAFLNNLFWSMRGVDKHIAVFIKPGRLMSIAETLVQGLDISYSRPDRNLTRLSSSGSSLHISLLMTDGLPSQVAPECDLIIGFDETFNADEARNWIQPPAICPSVLLFVRDSAEHIARQYPSLGPDGIISEANRRRAGVLEDFEANPSIKDVALQLESALLSGSREELERLAPQRILEESNFVRASKRALEMDATEDETRRKRPRSNSYEENDVQRDDIILIPNSNQMQGHMDSQIAPEVHTQFVQPPSATDPSRVEDSILRKRSIQKVSEASAALEFQMQENLTLRTHVSELEATLSVLQSRFEAQTKAHHALETVVKAGRQALEESRLRSEKKETTISDLRRERAALREELKLARKANADSEIPQVAEWEALRARASRADDLEKALKAKDANNDYVLSQYRMYQADATALKAQVEELSEQNTLLEKKASGETARLQALQRERRNATMKDGLARAEATEAQLQLALRQAAMQNVKLRDELERERGRKGMGAATRSSSLPPGSIPPGRAILGMLGGTGGLGGGGSGGTTGARMGSVSAATSRAASPAGNHHAGAGGSGIASSKTSPLVRTVELN